MLKLMKYLKKSAGWIALIVVLLFLQAYCDLSLPDYTSKIINVGIQQQGIEDPVPEKMRGSTMKYIGMFLSDEDFETVQGFYTAEETGSPEGDETVYILKDGVKGKSREELAGIIQKPLMIISMLSSGSEEMQSYLGESGSSLQLDLETLSKMPKPLLRGMMAIGMQKMDAIPDSIVTQAAINGVRLEYVALGVDVNHMQMQYTLTAGIKMLLMALLVMVCAVSVTFISARVAAGFGHDLRADVYRKVIGFSSREFNQFSTASLITRCTNDIQQVQMVMAMMFRIVLYAPILGIGGLIRVLNTDSGMTWILGVAIAAIMVLIGMLFTIAMPKFRKLQELVDGLNLVSREILTGIPVIRAFSREKHEEERFDKANRALMDTNLFVNRCMAFMMPAMMLIMNGLSVLIIYNGAYGVDNGTLQVGNMMAFIQYSMQIIMAFLMITAMSIMLPRANVAAGRIREVLDTDSSIAEPTSPKQPLPEKKGTVVFDHVSFAYPDAEENVLTDISFTASPGETVAIIGSTGCGKSTLVNLIPRFYDVSEGSIKVDGVDVREMDKKTLRERIGYVPQKAVLFSGTIDSNIRYGNEDIPDEGVRRAAEAAQAADFIEEKPDRYHQPIAQGGSNVSGGQKQRLSIARAIAVDPEIFIFDDSFSALDFKTDRNLRNALKEYTADATTIIVAQRISTVLTADRILVLEEGRLAGAGTHRELMENCEVYRQIAMSQLAEEELS